MSDKPLKIVAAFALLFSLTASVSAVERRILHTGVPEIAARLQRLGFLPATNRMQLAIGLPLHDQATLTNLLHQVYDLTNTNFHHYLTPKQFTERFGPTEQEYQNVKDYFTSHRLEVVGTFDNRALVDVAGSVSDIEKVFQVKMGTFQHPTENRQFFAPDKEPAVEASLGVTYIVGLDNYVISKPMVRTETADTRQGRTMKSGGDPADGPDAGDALGTGTATNGWYQGNDFRYAYVPGISLKGAGQVVGLFELDGYTPGDITKYETLAGLPPTTLQTVVLPGASGTPGGNNNEVCLDIEMVISMAPQCTVLIVEGSTGVDAMNEFAYPPTGVPLANQISSSFFLAANSQFEPQLIEMALQGQTFFLASGDSGATANGIITNNADYNYLTEVGATELYMNGTSTTWQSETVWDYQYIQGASSGYVDTGLVIPDFQATVNTTANGGSATHRNVPDVSMVGDYLMIVDTLTFTNGNPPITGYVQAVGGTSAAAPLWAAFTALVNQQGASQGSPTVGFLNPALYSIARGPFYNSCFHDVTNGNNTNTSSSGLYTAGPGYDNCTGLGSPNGPYLIRALLDYAGPVFVDFGYTGTTKDGNYDTPFNTLDAATNKVSVGGTIMFKTSGASTGTTLIRKAMLLQALDGTVSLGR
jgi:subtilase family serine protease